MPILTVYRHGGTGGIPPGKNDHTRALRGDVRGWSFQSIRSNTRFLYSIREPDLPDLGQAVTLTLRDCPDSHQTWHRMRCAFERRLKREGMILWHWVTEWQRRGVPHLHGAVWFADGPIDPRAIRYHWLCICEREGLQAADRAQFVTPITAAVGWFQYVSKHASRGLHHYQRSPEGIPAGWRKTGRMWGRSGGWPVQEAARFEVDHRAWVRYRRMIRSFRLADARKSLAELLARPSKWLARPDLVVTARRRVASARRMLRCHEDNAPMAKGFSEWIPEEVQIRMLLCLAAQGFPIVQE